MKKSFLAFCALAVMMPLAASADECDRLKAQQEELITKAETVSKEGGEKLAYHLANVALEGAAQIVCDTFTETVGYYEQILVLRKQTDRQCAKRFRFSCDTACVKKLVRDQSAKRDDECNRAASEKN